MKKIIFLLSFIIFYNTVIAQKAENVVYLKNGSIIRGKQLSGMPDSIVKMECCDGNIWAFKISEVDSIIRDKYYRPKNKAIQTKKGYNCISDMGIFLPLKENSKGYASLGLINSYCFIPNLATGIGINLDLDKQTYIPVYFNAQYYFNRHSYAPFIQFSIGHAFPKEKEIDTGYRLLNNNGGKYYALGLGAEFAQNENISILLSFVWRYQESNFKSVDSENYYELIDKNNRFALKFGLLFH